MPPTRWTARRDVVETLQKRWRRGDFLAALAEGRAVVPQEVSLRAPGTREIADRFGEVQDWVRRWEADTSGPRQGLRLEYGQVGGRLIGVNRLPLRVWVDDEPSLWRLLDVGTDVEAFRALLVQTDRLYPELRPWVHRHPQAALAVAQVWDQVLSVVRWVVDRGGPETYLRQIDLPGVDTKFVETHRTVLAELLDAVLPPERIDPQIPRSRFARRYRLAAKPSYLRCRTLDDRPLLDTGRRPSPGSPARHGSGPTELTLRVDELDQVVLPGRKVIIVENEITFLALPALPDALAVLGGGYGVTQLSSVTWLPEREIHYWGDLDTHGFAILDRLRAFLPTAHSLLMDRPTLEGHREHWGHEPTPVNGALERLTGPERDLYADLVEDRYAPALRLEQERIRFGAVRAALENLG